MAREKKIKYVDKKNRKISFHSFLCKDGCILYKVIRKDEAKLFLEYVEEENYYVVTCNKSISDALIEEYVKKNYEWILRWYKNLDDPAPWYVLGKQVPVKVIVDGTFSINHTSDLITIHLKYKRDYKLAVKAFYKEIGNTFLKQETEKLIKQLGLNGSFKETKWLNYCLGQCDWHKQITLSSRIMQYPIEFIDAVIYHEITHFTYMHHKKPFWDLLKQYCPNYKQLDSMYLNMLLKCHMW